MANFLILNQNYVQDGLGTLTFNIPSAGNYQVLCQTTVNPASSLVIQVKQGGATKYTAPAFTPTQSALQFKAPLVCAAADVITVVLTSSAAVDNQLNSIQSNISIGQGE